MKKHLILAILAEMAGIYCFSQVSIKNSDGLFKYANSVSQELGGHGGFGSINYERNLVNTRHYKLSPQISFSLLPSYSGTYIWVPCSVNHLFSFDRHHLETGIGFVLSSESVNNNRYFAYYTAKVGYRYQRPDGRMAYKILFTPLWEQYYSESNFFPWAAISVGYNFGK